MPVSFGVLFTQIVSNTAIKISEQVTVFSLDCRKKLYFNLLDWQRKFHVIQFCFVFVFFIIAFFILFSTVEMSTLTRENGTTTIKILEAKEVEGLIKEHEQVKAEEAKQAASKK